LILLFNLLNVKKTNGRIDIEITGICNDSRLVSPGNLFIAKKGNVFDGVDFIQEAIDSGACSVLSDIYNPFLKAVQIIYDDVASLESKIASTYYDNPSEDLFTIGVTGTNGKTAICYLLFHLLKESGLLGSIEYVFGFHRILSSLTTPDNISLQKYLKEMVISNCKCVSLEVSSHAILQKRINNIDFDIGIFTNITKEHLDYHKSIENYANAKKKFFDFLKSSSIAILNKDSPYYDFIKKDTKADVFSYSIETSADLMSKNIEMTKNGVSFDVFFKEKTFLMNNHDLIPLLLTLSTSIGGMSRYFH